MTRNLARPILTVVGNRTTTRASKVAFGVGQGQISATVTLVPSYITVVPSNITGFFASIGIDLNCPIGHTSSSGGGM